MSSGIDTTNLSVRVKFLLFSPEKLHMTSEGGPDLLLVEVVVPEALLIVPYT